MGRKSKLTELQWIEAAKRVLDGEPKRSVARSLGISESALREKISAQVDEIKEVANQIVSVEQRLEKLPIAAQITTQNLAARLRAISSDLANAAYYGAMTAHRLSGMAHAKTDEIDDADPEKSTKSLQAVATLTKLANSSSEIALNLLSANKETVSRINDEGSEKDVTPTRPQISRDEWLKQNGLS